MERNRGIGILDSGVGGLGVASVIDKIMPGERIIYFGDTAHLPYGDKSEEQIIGYVTGIIEFLKRENIKALILACNTSSAVVLPQLRSRTIPTLGVIEFAARLALKTSKTEKIGVVANPLTVKSCAYQKTLKGISLNGVMIRQKACPRWVPLVESGKISGPEVEEIIREDLNCLMESEIDTLILGCTHYPFLIPSIRKVIGEGINIVDPAVAVCLELKNILKDQDMLGAHLNPRHKFYVSGDAAEFKAKGSTFFGREIERVERVRMTTTNDFHHPFIKS